MTHITYTAEQQKANRDKWVAALRSGEFAQGRSRLRTRDGEFCCLGVACELAAREGVVEYDKRLGGTYNGLEAVPPIEVQRWLGLSDECGELDTHIRYSEEDTAGALTELNDGARWTFEQIADHIAAGHLVLEEDPS